MIMIMIMIIIIIICLTEIVGRHSMADELEVQLMQLLIGVRCWCQVTVLLRLDIVQDQLGYHVVEVEEEEVVQVMVVV